MNTNEKRQSLESEASSPHACEEDCGKYQDFITKFKRRGIWGFVIFRTVYTPESDEQFPIAIAKLDHYVRSDLEPDPSDRTSHKDCSPIERQRLIDNIMDCYKNTIFEDRNTLNNATAKDLSTHFRLWLASIERESGYHQCFGYSHFIIIDEESLNAITAPPSDIVHAHDCPCGPHAPAATFEPIIKLVRIYDRVVDEIAPYEIWFKYFWGSSDHR